MQAGRLRHRITLQAGSVAQDSFGAETTTWAPVGTVWAAIEALRGREYLDAKQQQVEVSTRVRMRYREGTTAGMRVRWTDPAAVIHSFEIVSVIVDATQRREMELMCVEAL